MRDWALVEERPGVPARVSWKELNPASCKDNREEGAELGHMIILGGILVSVALQSNWEINKLTPLYPHSWESAGLYS